MGVFVGGRMIGRRLTSMLGKLSFIALSKSAGEDQGGGT
jgi:hypothetical protein